MFSIPNTPNINIPKLHIIPLEGFLTDLNDHGFSIGVRECMQISKLLEASATRKDSSHQIKLKVAALLSKDAEQQRKIYRLFDAYLEKQSIHPPKSKTINQKSPLLGNWWKRNALPLILSIVGGVLMAATTYWYTSSYLLDVEANASHTFINDINGEVFFKDESHIKDYPPFLSDEIKNINWDFGDNQRDTGKVVSHTYQDLSKKYKVKYIVETFRGKKDDGEFQVQFTPICESSISYDLENFTLQATANSSLSNKIGSTAEQDALWGKIWPKTVQNLRYHWDFGDGNSSTGKNPSHSYAEEGEFLIQLTTQLWDSVAGQLTNCKSIDSVRVEVPQKKDLPLIPVSAIEMDLPDISDLVPKKEYWLYLILASIALGLYGLYEFLLWNKRRLVLDEKSEQLPPLRQKLRVEMPEINLYGNAYFGKVATLLRARRHSEVEDLNVPLTLQKSLQNGGEYPDFVYSTRLEASQYLVLIDERNKKDHLARFYESLVRELNHRDITAEYYFYDKDPSLCWKKRSQAVGQISISQLAATFAGYRLIIIGDGEGLLDPHTGDLAEYIPVFESWKEKALLSTVPNEDWGRGEDTLAEYFTFLPATEEGWEHLVPQWRLEEKTSPFHWRMQAFEVSPPPEHTENLIEELRIYLGEARFQWLCACAVYPNLYYELTLQLGERIYSGGLGLESLGHLFRLDWFRKGDIPTEIRLQLIEQLDPRHAKTTRNFLMEVLTDNPAPEGSLAQQDQQNTLSIYQYLNSDRNKEDLEELQKALEELDPEDLEDMISVKYLSEIKHNPLVIPLPKSFYKGGISLMGTKWKTKFVSVLAMIFLMILGLWLQKNEGFTGANQAQLEASDLVLNTALDSAYWYHYEGVQLGKQALYDSLFVSFGKAQQLGMLQSERKDTFMTHVWQARYNMYLDAYNREEFISASGFENGFLRDFPDTLASLPDFILYFVGISGLQANKTVGSTISTNKEALSEVDFSLQLLNRLDSSFYQGPDSTVFTKEALAKSALISQLEASGIPANSPQLMALYQKLGEEAHEYQLEIKTGDAPNANTVESEIIIQFASRKGLITTRLDSLVQVSGQLERNYSFKGIISSSLSLGEIREIEITLGAKGKRGLDDWLIDSLILQTPDGFGPYRFAVNRWLGDDTQQREPTLTLIPGQDIISNNNANPSPLDTTASTQPINLKIEGKVLDQEGTPLSRIEIKETMMGSEALTRNNGSFVLPVRLVRANTLRFQLQNTVLLKANGKAYNIGELRLDTLIDARDIPAEGLVFVLRDPISPVEPQEQNQPPQQFKFIQPEMVPVQGGTFMMGSPEDEKGREDDELQHEVQLSSYEIGKYEVTFEEYDLFFDATGKEKPEDEGWGRGNRPAINVSWEDAVAYCNWLSEQSGFQPVYSEAKGQYQINYQAKGYRLPTEAEWEFAARGGEKMRETIYAGSNDLDSVAWHAGNARSTYPIGQKGANELGVFDMSGNVIEWCGDWFASFQSSPDPNPKGPNSGSHRVLRGGYWFNVARSCRLSYRSNYAPERRSRNIGFRLALSP